MRKEDEFQRLHHTAAHGAISLRMNISGELFNVVETERKSEIERYGITENLGWKTVTAIADCLHQISLSVVTDNTNAVP